MNVVDNGVFFQLILTAMGLTTNDLNILHLKDSSDSDINGRLKV